MVGADCANQELQSLRQQEYKKLGAPTVLQWYHNADRPPGNPIQHPIQQDIDQQVSIIGVCKSRVYWLAVGSAFLFGIEGARPCLCSLLLCSESAMYMPTGRTTDKLSVACH